MKNLLSVFLLSVLLTGVAHAQCDGNNYLKMQNCSVNLDGSVTILNPWTYNMNYRAPLIHWAYPNSFDLMEQGEDDNCNFFGLKKAINVQIKAITDTEQANLHVVYIDRDQGGHGNSVKIEYPRSYWPKNDIYTSLTCLK